MIDKDKIYWDFERPKTDRNRERSALIRSNPVPGMAGDGVLKGYTVPFAKPTTVLPGKYTPLIPEPSTDTGVPDVSATPASWQEQMDGILQRILNREPFDYDINGDALYQQYKDQYTKQGQAAMEDTMGRAATLTGGYGNSYAVTAGQQAYDARMGELSGMIPSLYKLAYDQYGQEGDRLLDQYSLLKDREETDYKRSSSEATLLKSLLTGDGTKAGEKRTDGSGANAAKAPMLTDPDKIDSWADRILSAETEEEAAEWAERMEALDPVMADRFFGQWLEAHKAETGGGIDQEMLDLIRRDMAFGGMTAAEYLRLNSWLRQKADQAPSRNGWLSGGPYTQP